MEEKIITHTENPHREILSVASRTGLSANELDFNLLAFSTQYRFSNTEWQKISEKELTLFDKDEIFLKADLQIKQEYKIEIIQFSADILANSIQLVANKNLTKIIAQIDFRAFDYEDKLAIKLLQNIYKKMLKLKFLIGIRIFDFKQKLLNLVLEHKNKPIKEIVSLTIARGIEPASSQDETLVLSYKEKMKDFKIDEKRTGIVGIDENEVALRHYKAKNGKEGKSLNLQTLKVLEAKENKISFSCSNAFKAEEKEDCIEYITTKKGFIAENGTNYDIANELDFNGVDFKSVGFIRAGLDKNVKINVRLVSEMQDAVGSGVGIECEELNIFGSVAGNTQLNATRLKIDGTTHTKAKIYAKEGFIKTHRGYAEGDKISIDLLEGGSVKAKEVRIKKSLGGSIEADKVYIESLTANNTIIFYESAIIERFEGENNKINAKAKIADKDYEENLKDIENELVNLNQKSILLKQNLNASKNAVQELEKKVEELKESGQKIPENYQKMLQDYGLLVQELNKIQLLEKDCLKQKENLNEELLELQSNLLSAKFINKSGKFSAMSELKFSLILPKQDLVFVPEINDEVKCLALKKELENNKEIIELDKKSNYEEEDIQWLSPSKD